MTRNLLFTFFGLFGGLWLVWPGIISNKGWECTKDIVLNADQKPTDSQSFLKDLHRKLKITTSLSPKTLLKSEKLGPMDKFRVVGDACFRF